MPCGLELGACCLEYIRGWPSARADDQSMNCFAMYKKDRPHNASPKSGCPATAHNKPQTLSSITGIINNIYILSVKIP